MIVTGNGQHHASDRRQKQVIQKTWQIVAAAVGVSATKSSRQQQQPTASFILPAGVKGPSIR